MRKLIALALAVALALPVLASAADPADYRSESGWFDFAHCAFCKNLLDQPGLLEHSTWESHPTANGAMEIITVEPAYREAFAKAGAAIGALGAKIQSGEINPMTLEMCGRCQAYGMLMMSGVQMEEIDGDAATVFLYTSDKPEVVEKLHGFVARDNQEMAEMTGGHEHHPHSEHPHH